MKKIKIVAIVPSACVIILTLLNPSPARFKEYLGDARLDKYEIVTRRTVNGFIFSIYERQIIDKEYGYYRFRDPEKFYGFCLNFVRVSK